MNDKYEARITRITLGPSDETLCHKRTTTVEIEDDGNGEFIRITQADGGESRIDPEEWDHVCSAVESLMKVIRR